MSVERAEKKLREANFFLTAMRERLQRAIGDREEIDFYLSAFLGASKPVDYMLRRAHGHGAGYKNWRARWEGSLGPERALLSFFASDRDLEIHSDGSRRTADTRSVEISNEYSDASGRMQVTAPPGSPPATLTFPHYWFEVNGARREAIEVCAEYLNLVREKVAKFRSDHGL
jgi:hypothetical protein